MDPEIEDAWDLASYLLKNECEMVLRPGKLGRSELRPYGVRHAAGRSSTLIQPGSRRSKSL